MNFEGKKVCVVGLGISGMESALFLKEKGARVWVTERRETPEIKERFEILMKKGIKGEIGKHSLSIINKMPILVLSSGVNPEEKWIRKIKDEGKKIISEIDLGLMFLESPYIGVTGTNGKTTTVNLLKHILGEGAEISGNIETPLTKVLRREKSFSWMIIEVSSFQLKKVENFSPYISIFLNISPDHLNWHKDFNDYLSSKMKIFKKQKENQFALLNAEEDWWKKEKITPEVYFFSPQYHKLQGCFVKNGWIIWRKEREEGIMPLEEWKLLGTHNLYNLTSALLAGILAGKNLSTLRERARTFRSLPHRLEFVRSVKGINFINDSKATNVDAVYHALISLPPGIILILGGMDKGNDYIPLFPIVKRRVSSIIAVGESREKIYKEFSSLTNVRKAKSLEEAVKKAYKLALPPGTVLLSPACASFDEFRNYEERGEVFKEIVNKL